MMSGLFIRRVPGVHLKSIVNRKKTTLVMRNSYLLESGDLIELQSRKRVRKNVIRTTIALVRVTQIRYDLLFGLFMIVDFSLVKIKKPG